MSYFPMLTPLKDYIRSNALSLSDILSLAHQLCSALEILHQHNILHLDVSPDNIFVDYDGSFVLGDYSSSRYVFQNNWDNYFTPHFAPPEYQLFKPSIQSDLYSFAVLLFGLLHNGMIPDNIASLSLSDYADYQKRWKLMEFRIQRNYILVFKRHFTPMFINVITMLLVL